MERKLILWSDRFDGQKNNWRILALHFPLDQLQVLHRNLLEVSMFGSQFPPLGFVEPSKLSIQDKTTEDFKDVGCIELVLKKPPALRNTVEVW
ncbi:hypothetical protein PR048_018658, partial [Dryococelus australis]